MQEMRISEAMRLGAMMRPQVFGVSFRPAGFFTKGGSCAFFAAVEGAGCPTTRHPGELMLRPGVGRMGPTRVVPDSWLSVLRHNSPCPICSKDMSGLQLVAHLNDTHYLSRNDIADIVERIERTVYGEHAAERSVEDEESLRAETPVQRETTERPA